MTYPKPIMSITELVKLGFSREQLNRYVHIRGCPVYKTTPGKRSKWLFDTEEFEEWHKKIQL